MTALEAVDVTTGELITMGAPLTPDQAADRAEWVRAVMRAALTDGIDYGRIPGTGSKPALLKSGAEMLLLAAGLGSSMAQIPNPPGSPDGVTYRCTVRRASGFVQAECDGFAGYDESRFYRPPEDRRGEYRAPFNTLVKMAQKRAYVGAALNATAASGLFVADVDDDLTPADGGTKPVAKKRGRPPKAAQPTRPLEPGEAELEARILSNDAVRAAFREWRAAEKLPWPPDSGEQFLRMVREVDAIEAEIARDDYNPSDPEQPVGQPGADYDNYVERGGGLGT